MLKRNSIFLNVSSSSLVNGAGMGLSSLGFSLARFTAELIACPSLASCAFMLSFWKFFVPIFREYCIFLLFGNSLQNSAICIYPSMTPGTCVFFCLGQVFQSDIVLISLSSDDCFPPKKEYSEPCTCFCFDILLLTV